MAVQIFHEKGSFWGKGAPIVKYRECLCELYKTAGPIEMPFEMLTRVDPRNHVLDGVQISMERAIFEGEGHAPTCPTTL